MNVLAKFKILKNWGNDMIRLEKENEVYLLGG